MARMKVVPVLMNEDGVGFGGVEGVDLDFTAECAIQIVMKEGRRVKKQAEVPSRPPREFPVPQ